MKGFVAPRDPSGRASLYGPPPWHFTGRSITVLARCDAAGVAALVPPPLRAWGEPVVRFSVHDLFCDLGYGWDWAQANPTEACFREAVIGLAVEHRGRIGFWDPFLWTDSDSDSDAELAVGREFYGWPQRFGRIHLTPPHPLLGWRVGAQAAGHVSRSGRSALELSVRLEREGPCDVPQPKFEGFFVERVLPNPVDASRLREVFFAQMQDVTIADAYAGSATLELHAPELAPLGTPEPLCGQVHAVSWTKAFAERLASERLPPP